MQGEAPIDILFHHRLWQVALFGAALMTIIAANLPAPLPLPFSPGDKALHFIAFCVLTFLARLGWPRTRAVRVFLGLSMLGAAIEVLQHLLRMGREASLLDWVADIAAIVLMLGAIEVFRRLSQAFSRKAPPKDRR